MNFTPSKIYKKEHFINYFILQGNLFKYPLTEFHSIALHYAFKGNFIVNSLSLEQNLIIREGAFFIAKQANNYCLTNAEINDSIIITLLLSDQEFTNQYTQNLINNNLKSFFANNKTNYALLESKSESDIQKRESDKIYLRLMENRALNQSQLSAILKGILQNIDHNYTYNCNIISTTPLIEDILEYIRNNPATVSLKILSQKYNYSISYISELIHRETGLTFSQTLKSIRIEKSLELLMTTNKSINEIGEYVGYSSAPGFIIAFQNIYNMTPTEYRRSNFNLN